jgi:uncharacterized protein YfaS (alpha-2-macroglobulin family)
MAKSSKAAKTPFPYLQAVIGVLAACVVGVAAWFVWSTMNGPATPKFVQHVSARGELRMDLPEAMDEESTIKELSLPSGLIADSRWDGAQTLVLKPAAPLETGRTYEIVIGRAALTKKGEALGKDLVFRFVVAGAPKMTALVPSNNANDVPTDAVVTVVFDRPMVPLTQVQGDAAAVQMKDWNVTVEPAIAGDWRWISTYAAQLRPKGGLLPGTLYTIHIPAGLPSVEGDKTEEEVTWKFETIRPKVLSTEPENGYVLAGPTTQPVLHFNVEMNPESVAKHVQLIKTNEPQPSQPAMDSGPPPPMSMSGADLPKGTPVAIGSVKFGKKEENGKQVTDKTAIVVVPQKLEFGASYALAVTPGTLAAKGNLGTLQQFVTKFWTVGPLTVNSIGFEYGSATVKFSNPLPEGDMKKFITIDPKPEGWDDVQVFSNTWSDSTQLSFSPQWKPSTKYTITVSPTIQDTYGQKLGTASTQTLNTPPTPPQVAIAHAKGDFAIFESDKPPEYSFTSVNVKTVNIEFAKLSLDEFLAIEKDRLNYYNVPADIKTKGQYKSWNIPITDGKENEWDTITFDVEKRTGTKLTSGIYVLLVSSPEYRDYNNQPIILRQIFTLTDTSLTLKYSGNKALVWATDLKTGKGVKGAKLSFHSLKGTIPLTGTTDADGFFQSAINIDDYQTMPYEWQPEFWVTAERGTDFAFVASNWNGGFSAGEFGYYADFQSPDAPPFAPMTFFTTDRPVYRPGDTVSFKGMTRLKDWNGALQLPGPSRTVQVSIQDPMGTEVYKKTLPFTEYGGFSGEFPVGQTASLGSYYVTAQIIPQGDAPNPQYLTSFSVYAYRKPEYRVDLTTKQTDAFSGDRIAVDVEGAYYFGAPLSDAPVQWRAELTDYFFNKFTDGWYAFSTEDSWCYWNCPSNMGTLTEGKGTLDAAGHMTFTVPVDISDKQLSQIATIEANVTDPNNQLVSNRVSIPVHKAGVYVGIRPEDYGTPAGGKASVALIAVDVSGKPVGSQKIGISLYSRIWNTTRKKGVDGEYYYDNEPVDTLVSEQSVTSGTDGKARAEVTLPKGGQYMVVAQAYDAAGRVAKSSTSLYAWSDTSVNWPHPNNDRIDIIADKQEYKVGDIAKLLVKSPFRGENVRALVTVERENVITKKVIDVTSNALPIEIPVTEDLLPTAYVSVVIVKPRDGETYDDQGKDTGVPAFRIGYARLNIEHTRKAVDLDVTTPKDRYLPGEKVTATITATDADGKPVRGEFSFAAVDMSVLALAGFQIPDVLETYYGQRGLGVVTAQMLTYLMERYKPGTKGGGGDGAEKIRGNFRDTAYWNPSVVTDANGKATVTFTLPDNLTTWQLLAIGGTKDNKFGVGKKDVVETKDVIVRPVRPRFAVRGDSMTVSALVHNFLPTSKSFTVALSGSGFTVNNPSQKITVKPDEQAKVNFPIVMGNVSNATFRFSATTDGANDTIQETIPVERFSTPQTVASAGDTTSVVKEHVNVPTVKDAPNGTVSVTMSATVATYLPKALEFLSTYPYGCAEQTASSFLPHVILKRLQGYDAFKYMPDKQLDAKVTSGLQNLYGFQRGDGGFGFWQDSPRSNPYLTAYVLYALHAAKQTGYAVDAGVLNRAAGYLNGVLREKRPKADALDLATRTYILYVMSEIGQGDANLLNNMDGQRDMLPVFAQAELAMAFQNVGSTGKAKAVLTHILDNAKVDARGAHVEEPNVTMYRTLLQTDQRTTAEVLQAMIRIDPSNEFVSSFMRYILASRNNGHWDTTQSTVQSLLAFTDYLKQTKELNANELAGVEVNGKMLLTKRFAGPTILDRAQLNVSLDDLLRGKENIFSIGKDGDGKLYYDLLMSYEYAGDTLPAAEQGMSIRRDIFPMTGGENAAPTQTATVGDTYRVVVTMTVPEHRHDVGVESPLPAGLEPVDTNLATTQQVGLPTEVTQTPAMWWYGYEEKNSMWYFTHKELRDDRAFLFAEDLPPGVYRYTFLARATLPGTFKTRPARIWEMYYPENFGQSEGKTFTVKE